MIVKMEDKQWGAPSVAFLFFGELKVEVEVEVERKGKGR